MMASRVSAVVLPASVVDAIQIYRRQGAREFAWRVGAKVLVDHPYSPTVAQAAGEAFYRSARTTDIERYDSTIDPYELHPVNPADITHLTGRAYPPWKGWRTRVGSVRGGEWDCPPSLEELPMSPLYRGSDPAFYYRPRFEETPLHRALVARFEDKTPWTEIELIQQFISSLEAGECDSVWNGCSSRDDILRKGANLDRLFASIRDTGYRTQADLASGRQRWFLSNLGNEIRVDVGRTGEFLFVEGRHRLSIAKILDLESVPVLISVRHRRWVESTFGDQ